LPQTADPQTYPQVVEKIFGELEHLCSAIGVEFSRAPKLGKMTLLLDPMTGSVNPVVPTKIIDGVPVEYDAPLGGLFDYNQDTYTSFRNSITFAHAVLWIKEHGWRP
jgi:hypothetical protein